MSKKDITLLSGTDAIPRGCHQAGLLFECAPDGAAYRSAGTVVSLAELVGDFPGAKCKAYALARKLLQDEPPLRGVRQLGIFEEVVIRELQRAFHSIHLHRALQSRGIGACRVSSSSGILDGLRAIQRLSPASYRLEEASRPAFPRKPAAQGARVLNRLRSAGFSAAAVGAEWRQFLNAVDPYHRRTALSHKARTALRRGGIWFYSTAYTFTRAGMMYEPYFPERFTWLVENPHTGGRPLEEAGREFSDIYGFGRRFFRPSTKEVRQSRDEIVRHLQAVDLRGGDEELARRLFMDGGFFGEFLNVHLPKGLYFSALFESMLDAGRPRAVVVGNPVFEGYLLQQAKKRQVPTVLLQHGILGDYCQFWDPPVDDYVVRGSFWREFLADLPRRRAVVLNPPQETGQNLAPERGGRHILFLTAPYSMQEFFNELDLDEILRTLLAASTAHARQLLVRVHPIESVDYYRRKIEKLKNGKGGQVDVRFSHGPGLDVAVRGASVAVTYCSTVFLDCLRAGVPVVSFGWHDFSFKQQIGDRKLFHYARSLAELDALVGAAIKGELHSHSGAVESFLATTGEAQLREAFARMTGG